MHTKSNMYKKIKMHTADITYLVLKCPHWSIRDRTTNSKPLWHRENTQRKQVTHQKAGCSCSDQEVRLILQVHLSDKEKTN